MSDIHQMTTPLGEIALGDALAYIDSLRAEVYRVRSERYAMSLKVPCEGARPGAKPILGDIFTHRASGIEWSVVSIKESALLAPTVELRQIQNN